LGSRGSDHIPTNPIEPPQSQDADDDNPTCAHPITIAVEEVTVPIEDIKDMGENHQEEDFGESTTEGGGENEM
jgi:hypothetical protein